MSQPVAVTAPTPNQIVLTRAFAAPAALVFDAFTTPELLVRWHGARGWNLVVCEVDLRPGGAWRFVSEGPGGARMGHGGVYRLVEPGRRVVHTERYDDQWFPGESLVDVAFAEDGGTTTVTTTTVTTTLTFPTQQVRDLVLASPMERGVGESYDRLAAVLAEATTDRRDRTR